MIKECWPFFRPSESLSRAGPIRFLLRSSGELAITLGAVLILFCAYLVWGTATYAEQQQHILRGQLTTHDRTSVLRPVRDEKIKIGSPLALIHIPRLGTDYQYTVVEGVDEKRLRQGPGHYPGSALPGEIGNFVISGHRTTYGAPFRNINRLQRDDEIIVVFRQSRYVYRVQSSVVVNPDELSVIAPVPRRPGREATQAMVTLTTCEPEYSARQRLIVFGVLADVEERAT